MWIKRIKLKNFGLYPEAEFIFPEPTAQRNLVVINAKNGHGKTTLLEALYLCLFDKEAIGYFQRAALSSSVFKYQEFMNSVLHQEAKPEFGFFTVELEVELIESYRFGEQGICINRKWYFDLNRQFIEQDNQPTLRFYNQGSYELLNSDDIQEYLEEYSLPAEYSPVFFFDGEQVVNVAKNFGKGGWMEDAFNGLLGIDFLLKLKHELNAYSRRVYSERADDKQKIKLTQLEQEFQVVRDELEDLQREASELQQQKLELETQRDDLNSQLSSANSTADVKKLTEKIAECQTKLEETEKQFWQVLIAMPLAMLPENDIIELDKQINADYIRLKHEHHKEDSEHRVEDFLDAFAKNENALKVLGEYTLTNPLLQQALRESWDKLWVLPENASDPMQHNYLSEDIFQATQANIARIAAPNNQLDDLNSQKQYWEKQLHHADQQYALSKEKDPAGQQQTMRDELLQLKTQLAQISQKHDGKNMEIGRRQSDLERLENSLTELHQEMMGKQSGQIKAKRADKVCSLIDELTHELRLSKLEALRHTTTSLHKKIAHDNHIDEIVISPEGGLSIYSQNKTPIEFKKLSHGEKKALILTLIFALAEITDYQVPFVVDTPFASLDPEHRANLLTYWRSLKRQIIILSQPAEITPEVYADIQGNIAQAYTVTANSLKSGGKASQVEQGIKL